MRVRAACVCAPACFSSVGCMSEQQYQGRLAGSLRCACKCVRTSGAAPADDCARGGQCSCTTHCREAGMATPTRACGQSARMQPARTHQRMLDSREHTRAQACTHLSRLPSKPPRPLAARLPSFAAAQLSGLLASYSSQGCPAPPGMTELIDSSRLVEEDVLGQGRLGLVRRGRLRDGQEWREVGGCTWGAPGARGGGALWHYAFRAHVHLYGQPTVCATVAGVPECSTCRSPPGPSERDTAMSLQGEHAREAQAQQRLRCTPTCDPHPAVISLNK